MGELRAYAVDVARLRALLHGGPDRYDEIARLVQPSLSPGPAPAPFGPVFTRVPGTRVVRDDDPTPADLDRLLAGGPFPAARVTATWRLVEALVTGLAVGRTRSRSERPDGLGPHGLPLPEVPDLVVGAWTLTQAQERPDLRAWLEDGWGVSGDDDPPDVLVFWSQEAGGGPAG